MAVAFSLELPSWLAWPRAVALLDRQVRVPGEVVDVAGGVVAWSLAGSALRVCADHGELRVDTTAEPAVAAAAVRSRFHLDLDAAAVTAALDDVAGMSSDWVRRPAAASCWAFCVSYLCGGNPDAPSTQRMFETWGSRPGEWDVVDAPTPAAIRHGGTEALTGFGIKTGRAAQLLLLAELFADSAGDYEAAVIRELPPDEALARVAELPHIGANRARELTSTALGHDDVTYQPQGAGEGGEAWSAAIRQVQAAAPWRSVACDTLADQSEGQ